MPDLQIPAPGVKAAPLIYLVPGSVELILKAAFATFDGSGAGGAFLPCLRVLSPAGLVVGEYVTDASVAAGSSAEVSFAPFLRSASPGGTALTGSWAMVRGVVGAGAFTHVPLGFTAFATSDTSAFATATAAAPTVAHNATGDATLLFLKTGLYFIAAYATTPAGAGVYRNLTIQPSVQPGIDASPPHGQGDLHGVSPNMFATVLLDPNGNTMWFGDHTLFASDVAATASNWVQAWMQGGGNNGYTLYMSAVYIPAGVGALVY